MYEKDFVGWHRLKQSTEEGAPRPTFNNREIWWCSVGVNIGHEIDGKNRLYNRPVLVIKKFNSRTFWGLAMTTKIKDDSHYFPIEFQGRTNCIILSHLRLYDSKRLHSKAIGKIPPKQFEAIKTALKGLL